MQEIQPIPNKHLEIYLIVQFLNFLLASRREQKIVHLRFQSVVLKMYSKMLLKMQKWSFAWQMKRAKLANHFHIDVVACCFLLIWAFDTIEDDGAT